MNCSVEFHVLQKAYIGIHNLDMLKYFLVLRIMGFCNVFLLHLYMCAG